MKDNLLTYIKIIKTGSESLEFLNKVTEMEGIFPLFYLGLSNLNRDTLSSRLVVNKNDVTRSRISAENNRKFA